MGHRALIRLQFGDLIRHLGRAVSVEEDDGGDGGGEGPEEGGLVVDAKDDGEVGKTALGGEGDGPVEVVVQADS